MNARQILVVVFIALCVAGLALSFQEGLLNLNVGTAPRNPMRNEVESVEPPPEFGARPTLEERRSYWMRLLYAGDQSDVDWARRQLLQDGEESRAKILAAAKRSVGSNPAFVQHALDLLLTSPRPDLVPLCREVLTQRDAHGVIRAAAVLGAIGSPASAASAQLAEAAVTREYPVPRDTMNALASIGTDEARRAVVEAAPRMDAAHRPWAFSALARIGGDEATAFLRDAFAETEDPALKLAAAEALLQAGDATPSPWLREQVERLAAGSHYSEAAIRVLAGQGDESVLARLAVRVRDRFEQDEAREQAVGLLRAYRLDQKEILLRSAAARGNPERTRSKAHEELVHADAPGARGALLALLSAAGEAGREDRKVAAFTLGRLRDPSAAAAIRDSLATTRPQDEELRAYLLRALVLSGDPESAELIVRAMVADHTAFGVGGVAFNVSPVLGEMTPSFRKAFGTALLLALGGEFGELSGSGLQVLLISVPATCGREAAAVVEPFALHADWEIREAAVSVIPFVARPESVKALRRAWRRKQDEILRDLLRDALEKSHYSAE